MASSKDYLEYVLEQLSEAGDVTSRAMMSEYILYFRGKVIGGIYDNRFLVKPVQAARNMMPDAPEELPYDGAKPMLMVENIEDREFLKELFEAMYDELPAPKPKKEEIKKCSRPAKADRELILVEKKFADYVICAKNPCPNERTGTISAIIFKLLTRRRYTCR